MDYARKESEERFVVMKGGKRYTFEDVELLPDDERAELIDGEMFIMQAPGMSHQDILGELFMVIQLYLKKNNRRCKAYMGLGAFVKRDKYNYLIPDISVVCDRDRLEEKGCQGSPDWVIEIVSPSTRKRDYERKLALYRETGTREYWIVDRKRDAVFVYRFEQDGEVEQYSFSDRIKVGIYDDLYIAKRRSIRGAVSVCEKDRNVGSNICQQQLWTAVMVCRSRSAPNQRRRLHYKCSITTAKESESLIPADRMF